MKLRTNHNSIRIRLSQSNLEQFATEGKITESVNFSLDPNNTLYYSLVTYPNEKVNVEFINNHLTVFVPHALAQQWTTTERVGFHEHLNIANNQQLFVLIEKDFQCLDDRPYEDETDNFPNPNAGKAC